MVEITEFGVYRDFYEDKRIFTYCLPPKSRLMVVKGKEKYTIIANPTMGIVSGYFFAKLNYLYVYNNLIHQIQLKTNRNYFVILKFFYL